MNKKVLFILVVVICVACAVTAFFMSKKFIKKKTIQERFEVVRVIESI